MATRPRSILVVSLWLVLATALVADERPNLVFILADDLGYDYLDPRDAIAT